MTLRAIHAAAFDNARDTQGCHRHQRRPTKLRAIRYRAILRGRAFRPDLATLARNTITTAIAPHHPLTVLTRPTPIQQKAFDLLGVKCGQ